MKLRDALGARRRKTARKRYEQECARQTALQGQDAQDRVKDVAGKAGPMSFPYSS
ncbi:MAG: hypothetical protein M3R39_02345 [Actinomycetota bacterium]|nr:hypothetical protein [Actinomycetota bacterium]